MDLGLSGRACVVTGASRGIGLATARMLCAEGAYVLLVARSEGRLCRGGRRVRGRGPAGGWPRRVAGRGRHRGRRRRAHRSRSRRAPRSARRPRQQRRQRQLARPRRRPRRGLVRGLGDQRDGADAPDARRRSRRCASAAGAASSTSPARRASARRRSMAEYSVAKAAELSLSRLLRRPLRGAQRPGQRHLPRRASSRSSGWTRAACSTSRGAGGARQPRAKRSRPRLAGRPIGRLAEVEEVAAAIVFLCSEHASYTSGAAWSVDGGIVQVII